MGCTSNKVIECTKKNNLEKSKKNKKEDMKKEAEDKIFKNMKKDLEIKMDQEKENTIKDLKKKKNTEEENIDKSKNNGKKQIEESETILLKISSKYMFNKITDYIEDKMLMLKLVNYSKKLQNKLNYGFIVYQNCYFMKIKMYPQYYFYKHLKYGDNLEKGLEEDLKINKIDAKSYENFIINYWKIVELSKDLIKEGYGYPIVINSPFINILSKTKYFDKYKLIIKIIDDNLNNNYNLIIFSII